MPDFYEAQAEAMRNVPGLSINDSRFIDHWVDVARADDRHHVKQVVDSRRARDRDRIAKVAERIDAMQDDFVRIRKQAERNEVPWADLAKVQRQLARERFRLESVLESLQSSEATCAAMEADPVGHLVDFYQRWSTLQDNRPNLADDLAADQRKRGVRAIS